PATSTLSLHDALPIYYYAQLESGETGMIAEADIEPLCDVPRLADVEVSEHDKRAALDATAVIKLNGGLGTSMGMDQAKSLLPVRDRKSTRLNSSHVSI